MVPTAGGTLTVQGQEVPTRIHARRGRGGGDARRDSSEQRPTDLGSQAQAGARTRLDCGGRRQWGWVHGPAPPPEPANRRFSPPLRGTGKGRKEGGPGSLAKPGPGSSQLGAPGPEIVRFLLLPPPPPPTGPVITAGCRPHALPVGASPLWGCG